MQAGFGKEHLFRSWTTTPTIANVVIGIPTEEELNTARVLLDEVRNELSAEEDSTAQKFMHAMIAGIEMEYEDEKVEQCSLYLDSIEEELQGIAGSRVLRFQLRCAQLQGDTERMHLFADSLRDFEGTQIEDIAVLCLYEVERAMLEGDSELAQQLYVDFDAHMCATGAQFVRLPVALGYARVANSQENSVFALFTLADWLTEFGYKKVEVQERLLSWLSRLQPSIDITPSSPIPAIASFAMELKKSTGLATSEEKWIELTALIQRQQYEEAIPLLEPFAEIACEQQYAAMALLDTIRPLTTVRLGEAFLVSKDTLLPVALSRSFNSTTVQQLLQQAINQTHTAGETPWVRQAILVLLAQDKSLLENDVLAESYRLVGDTKQAKHFFMNAIAIEGEHVQLVCGFADCNRDSKAMRIVVQSTNPDDASSYWYWLANLRMLQWYAQDGGDQAEITAKINRLRKKDASLGGAQFISKFNALLF